jgi:hypothetical protein
MLRVVKHVRLNYKGILRAWFCRNKTRTPCIRTIAGSYSTSRSRVLALVLFDIFMSPFLDLFQKSDLDF